MSDSPFDAAGYARARDDYETTDEPPVDPYETADDPLDGALVTRRLDTVTPERVSWLWPGYLPAGKLITLDGDPGLGKSTLALSFAALVTTGKPWPDGTTTTPADVVLLSAEDGVADTIRPRLDAAGADASRVVVVDGITYTDDDGTTHQRPPELPRDVPRLARLVHRTGARLVIVDVLMAYLSGDVNSHRDQDVRRALAPLKTLAEQTGATVVALRHLNKGNGPALYRGGGSIGIGGAARLGLIVALDPDDPTERRRILAIAKTNLGPKASSLSFQLTADDDRAVAVVEWLGTDSRHADELLALGDRDERTERDELVERLRDYLTEHGGRAPAGEVLAAMRREGYAPRTIQRARSRAGVESTRDGMRGPWLWRLAAEDATEGAEGANPQDLASSAPSWRLQEARCAVCGEPMTVAEPAQTTHPNCDPTAGAEQ